jgi:hypothetical protein
MISIDTVTPPLAASPDPTLPSVRSGVWYRMLDTASWDGIGEFFGVLTTDTRPVALNS